MGPSSRSIALWAGNGAEWREVFGLEPETCTVMHRATAGARVSDDMYHVDIRGSGPELARFSYRCHVRIAQLFDILDDESCDFNAIA
jgi:hypothetical protein